MAIISIYIRDEDIERVTEAICSNYRYDTGETNPWTKEQFVNKVIRKFITDNVKTYEIEEAKRIALAGKEYTVITDDGATATIHKYYMICVGSAKAQYDYIAGLLSPGNSFDIPLGNGSITHWGLEVGITETARQQLLALELSGGTSSDGEITLFYARCNTNSVVEATNADQSIVGTEMSMSDFIQLFNYEVIE